MSITYDRAIFAENLRRLTEANKERQADIARLLEVSKSTVSAYFHAEQMPRMDKLEQLAHHFGVPLAALLGSDGPVEVVRVPAPAPAPGPAEAVYRALNEQGQTEFLRYGRYLAAQPEYKAPEPRGEIAYIKHYLVPAAAGYASPIEGEDYELMPRDLHTPAEADFCISIQGDSMAPYIPDGSLVYVKRDAPLQEFDAGVFFVDGDVLCKQWCVDYTGTLHLLSANPLREDANRSFPRDSGQTVICFGKVLLDRKLPRPVYEA